MTHILDLTRTFWADLSGSVLPGIGFWNYIFLGILVLVEGPIATLAGAAAASAGLLKPALVFFAAATGNLCADISWYTLGYVGKLDWLVQKGRWLGIKPGHVRRMQQEMNAHAPKLLLFAKLSVGFVIPSLVAAGLARVPVRRWLPFLLLGETIWTGGLVIVGYYTTQAIQRVEHWVGFIILGASILFVLGNIWWIRRAVRKDDTFREVVAGQEDEK
ncbi:MAG: hypothetical protein GYA17_09235 [Chloroflexi bacterium]|jgi:membrane protein DedA with SNARE-associated domain|nr:VTT domain-containing protein [Anaerolineaceae bacterium]NMB88532.1 hypothetical protein [Chloroflexota bacterium]